MQNMNAELAYSSDAISIPDLDSVVISVSGQTVLEERINTWTHGLGVVLALVGFVALALKSADYGGYVHLLSCSIYATSLVLMFTSSAIYHSRPDGRWKEIFRVSDHICIYFLIAGSYTPFAFLVLKQQYGGFLFWWMWGIALFGTLYKIFAFGRFPGLSLALYLGMGWSGVLVFGPLKEAMSSLSFSLLVIGGIFYSVGTIFYAIQKIPFNHCIWHLFVMAGAASHFFSVYYAMVPV